MADFVLVGDLLPVEVSLDVAVLCFDLVVLLQELVDLGLLVVDVVLLRGDQVLQLLLLQAHLIQQVPQLRVLPHQLVAPPFQALHLLHDVVHLLLPLQVPLHRRVLLSRHLQLVHHLVVLRLQRLHES